VGRGKVVRAGRGRACEREGGADGAAKFGLAWQGRRRPCMCPRTSTTSSTCRHRYGVSRYSPSPRSARGKRQPCGARSPPPPPCVLVLAAALLHAPLPARPRPAAALHSPPPHGLTPPLPPPWRSTVPAARVCPPMAAQSDGQEHGRGRLLAPRPFLRLHARLLVLLSHPAGG
jgi:hypothetical protein